METKQMIIKGTDDSLAKQILHSEALKKEIDEATRKRKDITENIKTTFEAKHLEEVIVDDGDNDHVLSALLVNRAITKIDDVKMKQLLTKEQWKQIVNRVYVCDESKLRAFVKKHKADTDLVSELKQMISSIDAINEAKLAVAIQNNEINPKDIAAAINTTVTKSMTIKRKKR